MKTHISCKDNIEIKGKSGNKRKLESFGISVEDNEYSDDETLHIHFRDCSFMGSTAIPVKYWAELKDTVDKLIIKAEHLKKEDC